MNITIQTTKPFSSANGQALSFTGSGPQGPIEGVIWSHPLIPAITPGVTISVVEDKNANWKPYKGSNRFNINSGASITILGAGQPAAQQTPPAAPQGPNPAHQSSPTAKTGEEVLNRAAELVNYYFQALVAKGIPAENAWPIAAMAPEIVSAWWFGEKSA